MNGTTKIIGFKEDRGKNKDGRLTIKVNQFPSSDITEFLEWLGGEFIKEGGLYAVDIVNPNGTYRVYKDENEINTWINKPIKN